MLPVILICSIYIVLSGRAEGEDAMDTLLYYSIEDLYHLAEACNTTVPVIVKNMTASYFKYLGLISYHYSLKVADLWINRAVDFIIQDDP
ncbi:hypothetical protein GE061_020091 [Apolygus lucorum]|uniref:Uncharacterized protein n=1 Tax=Apolygus lucorum TaxID=248454 RepID=A0A8S9XE94_APOLU|nr:hypothetical protein GE061_020091 [Apolygus lucorum]